MFNVLTASKPFSTHQIAKNGPTKPLLSETVVRVSFGALGASYGQFLGSFRALIGRSSAPRLSEEGAHKSLSMM